MTGLTANPAAAGNAETDGAATKKENIAFVYFSATGTTEKMAKSAAADGYPVYGKLGFKDKAQKYTDMRITFPSC